MLRWAESMNQSWPRFLGMFSQRIKQEKQRYIASVKLPWDSSSRNQLLLSDAHLFVLYILKCVCVVPTVHIGFTLVSLVAHPPTPQARKGDLVDVQVRWGLLYCVCTYSATVVVLERTSRRWFLMDRCVVVAVGMLAIFCSIAFTAHCRLHILACNHLLDRLTLTHAPQWSSASCNSHAVSGVLQVFHALNNALLLHIGKYDVRPQGGRCMVSPLAGRRPLQTARGGTF